MGDTFLGHPGTQLVTADGIVGRSGLPVRVYHVHINSGAAAGVVNLRNGSTVAATIWAICNGTGANQGNNVSFGECGILLPAGCYVDVDANVTSVAVTFSTEN